jgi:hypothetical protein
MIYLALGALLLCLIALPISLGSMISARLRRRAGWAAIGSTVGLVASFVTFGYARDMQKADPRFGENTRRFAQNEIAAHSAPFSEEVKRSIANHKVLLEMTPQEAGLAGGSFAYKVRADPARWAHDSDPLVVIASQTLQPDDSKITLTFRNATQFDTPEPIAFRVEVRRGRVTEIIPLSSPKI